MAYPNGTPCPDYERLELAHDLLAGALHPLAEALAEADEWDQSREGDLDEGLATAERCEAARQEALQRVMDGASRLAQAAQDLMPLAADQRSGGGPSIPGPTC
jgi:hypothetical protein